MLTKSISSEHLLVLNNSSEDLAGLDDDMPVEDIPLLYTRPWRFTVLEKSISFIFHIFLIAIFEGLFYFYFITAQEDGALLGEIENYNGAIAGICSRLSSDNKNYIASLLSQFINPTELAMESRLARQLRDESNGVLFDHSMYIVLFFGCLLFLLLIVGYRFRNIIYWRHILVDNIVMIGLLAIYEYSFFRIIVTNYDAISQAELSYSFVMNGQKACNISLGRVIPPL
jgi:hypothetical protein